MRVYKFYIDLSILILRSAYCFSEAELAFKAS